MKIGLFGFGKTGKAVASVILQNKEHSLQWIYRKTNRLNNRSASEFFGIESTDAGNIYSENNLSIEKLLDEHPVDAIIDFSSSDGIYTYGDAAAKKNVKIISAISHYTAKEINFLKKLAKRLPYSVHPILHSELTIYFMPLHFLKK